MEKSEQRSSTDKVVIGCLGGSLAAVVVVLGFFLSAVEGCGGMVQEVAFTALDGENHKPGPDPLEEAERTMYGSWVIAAMILVAVGWYLLRKNRKG